MAGTIFQNMIIVRKGDSFDILIQLKHGEKSFMDLTDCTIKMDVRDDNNLLFSKEAEIIEAQNGKARIKLSPKETTQKTGNYKTDIQLRLKNGDVHTIFPSEITQVGVLKITPEITE